MIRPQTNAFRELIDLSGIWRICFDPDGVGRAQGWTSGLTGTTHAVAVPGSWNEQLAEAGYMNYVGDAWYQTDVIVPPGWDGRTLLLRFDSADYGAEVWMNGHPVGRSGAEHLPFECDVTQAVRVGGSNRLVVCASNLLPEQGPTQRVTLADYAAEGRIKEEYLPAVRYDFFPYGGLARPVRLCAVPATRITEARVRTGVTPEGGLVQLDLSVSGEVDRAVVAVNAPDGSSWTGVIWLSQGATGVEIALPGCPLWSPQAPNLVDVRIDLVRGDGRTVDQVRLRTGVRSVEVAGTSLLLNGQPIMLKGFGKHEDSPIHGRALNLPQMVKDFQLLRWCGANSVRTSHYPYAEEFYDFCDEQGILVIDEVFSINLDFRKVAPEGLEAHKQAISQLIARDGHRACVIAWSLANEPGYLGEANYVADSAPYWAELFAHARSLDPTRPLTHANVGYAGLDDPAFIESDFLMINRYYGWYHEPAQLERAVARLVADFDHLAAAHGKPVFVSEFGADALAGQHATYPQLFTEDFQADFIEAYWRAIQSHPSVIGGHVWNFADFRTAQHGRRVVFNLKGVFTRDRTPKKAAHTVRRLWRDPDTA
jgi:beta-glucuronidase